MTLPNGITTELVYDPADRLTSLIYTNTTQELVDRIDYEYDRTGDRIAQTGPVPGAPLPAPFRGIYNAANQLTETEGATLTYDPAGNLEKIMDSQGTTRLVWDTRGRLTRIEGPSGVHRFTYDGLGRRVSLETPDGLVRRLQYDFDDIVAENAPDTGFVSYLGDLAIDTQYARVSSNGTRYPLLDVLNSIVKLTDETGTVKTRYAYAAFGETSVAGEAGPNRFQFTGRENDASGFYFYRGRYYAPHLRRFLSEDPVETILSAYAYVDNAPLNFIDPLGEQIGVPGGVGGAFVPGIGGGPGLGQGRITGGRGVKPTINGGSAAGSGAGGIALKGGGKKRGVKGQPQNNQKKGPESSSMRDVGLLEKWKRILRQQGIPSPEPEQTQNNLLRELKNETNNPPPAPPPAPATEGGNQ